MSLRIITYLKDRMSRIGHMRGFGIQSPWAYQFVREVIAERLPYYAYSDIDALHLTTKAKDRLKLYFRIVNRLQPDYIVDLRASSSIGHRPSLSLSSSSIVHRPSSSSSLSPILHSACRKATVTTSLPTEAHRPLILADITTPGLDAISYTDGMLIVEGLTLNDPRWPLLRDSASIGVTFDLGPFALCSLNLTMYKQHYKI